MAVKVQLDGDGLKYEAETTAFQAAQIIGFLSNQAESSIMPTAPLLANQRDTVSSAFAGHPVSLSERFHEVGASTNPQKIVTIGAYLIDRDNVDRFSVEEIRPNFAKAGERPPQNLSRDIREAVHLGYIFESDEKDRYHVTAKAMQYLQDGFPKQERKASKRNGSSRQATPKASLISEAVKNLPFSTLLDGYPGYAAMSTKSDKILWILLFADVNGVRGLSGQEVDYIGAQLRDNIPSKQLTSWTTNALRKGMLARRSNKYVLLQRGMDYLKGLGD